MSQLHTEGLPIKLGVNSAAAARFLDGRPLCAEDTIELALGACWVEGRYSPDPRRGAAGYGAVSRSRSP